MAEKIEFNNIEPIEPEEPIPVPPGGERDVLPQPQSAGKTDIFSQFGPRARNYLARHFRPETLEKKINDLRAAGLENPIPLIERQPPLAGLDIQRVKNRIQLIQRLNKRFGLNYDPLGIIEIFPPYLSYSRTRLFFFLRVASFYNLSERIYRRIILQNPFLIFGELLENPRNLRKGLGYLRKLNKQEKTDRIKEVMSKLPKIRDILKTYPKKQREFLLRLAGNLQRQIEEPKRRKMKE